MVSLVCPRCGAPCRVPLAEQPALACGRCGHRDGVPEEIARRVRAAVAALSTVGERSRQFHGLRGAVASSAAITVALYLLLAVALAGVAASITNGCQGGSHPVLGERIVRRALLPGMAATVTLVLSVFPLLGLLRTQRRIRAIARALPPLRAGEPSACRVCGAPVPGLGIVRCAFCASDNVVDAQVLARAGEEHRTDAAHLEDEVLTHAAALGEARGLGFPLISSLALLAVPFSTVWFGGRLFDAIEGSPTTERIFAVDELDQDAYTDSPGHVFCVRAESWCAHRDDCITHERVAPRWLEGKTRSDGRRIVRVRENYLRGLELVLDRGEVSGFESTCVRGEPSEQWRALAARREAEARRGREDAARAREEWKKQFPNTPYPELQPVPLPPLTPR